MEILHKVCPKIELSKRKSGKVKALVFLNSKYVKRNNEKKSFDSIDKKVIKKNYFSKKKFERTKRILKE